MTVRTTDSLDGGRVTFREPDTRTQVSDPVCGMDVEPAMPGTGKAERNGTTYFFCSASCKEKFDQNPEEFIAPV